MVIQQSLEEELELEKNVRDVQSCDDGDALRTLCVFGENKLASSQNAAAGGWSHRRT